VRWKYACRPIGVHAIAGCVWELRNHGVSIDAGMPLAQKRSTVSTVIAPSSVSRFDFSRKNRSSINRRRMSKSRCSRTRFLQATFPTAQNAQIRASAQSCAYLGKLLVS